MKTGKILIIIFLAAVALRVVGNAAREKLLFSKPLLLSSDAYYNTMRNDARWYDAAARGILQGRGVISMEEKREPADSLPAWFDIKRIGDSYYLHRLNPPLYPLFLALCYLIAGANTLAYFIPQVIISSLTCVLIFLLVREFSDQRPALLAGLMVAFYPDLIFWSYQVLTETLFIFLLALGFLLLLKGNRKDSMPLVVACGAVFGMASLTRVTFIPFIPILFLWQAFFTEGGKRKAFARAFVIIVMIGLILLPWALRNYAAFGKFTALTEEAGIVLFVDREDFSVSDVYYTGDRSHAAATLVYIRDHIGEYSATFFRQLATFWGPFTGAMRDSAKLYKGLTWLLVFPLSFLGMVLLWIRKRTARILVVFVIYYSLLHAASYVDKALIYRYPIQPFLCIFAAYGFWMIYDRFFQKGLPSSP